MPVSVKKRDKVCATCKNWSGPVKDWDSNYIHCNCGIYDKFKCNARNGGNAGKDMQANGHCTSNYESKY